MSKNLQDKNVYLPKGKFFKRLFLSYILIVFLCFITYTVGIIYESITINNEQVDKYYTNKALEMSVAMDKKLYNAQSMVSNVNSSSVINKFYLNIRTGETLNSYMLYQVLNDLTNIKTATGDLNIYDIVLSVNGYNKVYTGGDVINISQNVDIKPLAYAYFGETNLNSLFQGKNSQLLFYKDYLIYSDKYRYMSGSVRGNISILFEKADIIKMLDEIVGEDACWRIKRNGETVVKSENEYEGRIFSATSWVNSNYTYEIIASPNAYRMDFGSFIKVALFVGMVLCTIYIVLAYFLSRKYYSPIKVISSMIDGDNEKEKNEVHALVEGVEHLIGERNGYKEKVITITPYAKKGVLWELMAGEINKENLDRLWENEMALPIRLYYLLSVINIRKNDNTGNDLAGLKNIKEMIFDKAKVKSDSDVWIFCCEKDLNNIYIILNSDRNEILEDFLYDFYEEISKQAQIQEYVLTMGVDEIKEEVEEIKESATCALKALDFVLVEGYGGIKFYEKDVRKENIYYFPDDGIKRISKALKELDISQIRLILNEISEKNTKEYDLTLSDISMLKDELYMLALKSVKNVTLNSNMHIRIEKPDNTIMTFEEITSYYENVYSMVMEYIRDNKAENIVGVDKENDIIRFVDENYRHEDLSLNQIMEKYNVSSKYISSVFKKRFNTTYLQYVSRKRISYAAKLMNTTALSLEEIAKECGYTNLLTFRRNFKNIMNMNPGEYKTRQND